MLATLLAILPTPATAFWEYGHETVGAIAYRNVTPKTRLAIDRLLRKGALLETPECPVSTIGKASYWADCVKTLGQRFSYAFSWHYQNVDVCRPFDLKDACRDGNCVSAQVERNAKLLADRKVPERERLMALAFLVHFVGDLHMPLHAGDRSDRGGNDVRANYGIAGGRLNLHSIWDGPLAERALSTPPSLVRVYAAGERAAMAGGTVEDWSRESWAMARDFAYATALDGNPCGPMPEARAKIGNAEIETLIAPMREGVVRGGLRLARMLDEALG